MIVSEKLKFTLSPGYWDYFFRNKNSLQPLTARQRMLIDKETEIEIVVPSEVKNNKDAVIHIMRMR